VSEEQAARVRFRDVLRIREFRWLWLADAQSNVGDQIARVALAILVFRQTGSAVATASTYALTFLPAVLGGALLSGLADRFPRRTVMVGCDIVRAVIIGLMALPGLPTWLICVLLVVAVLAGSPFSAAQAAILPDVLAGDEYVVATALRTLTSQLAQMVGFAGGGLLVAGVGSRGGLLIDAVSFAASGVMIGATCRLGAVNSADQEGEPGGYLRGVPRAMRLIWDDRRLRAWLGLTWIFGFYVTPEGIAAPLATSVGGGAGLVGVLMAAAPTGTAVGALVYVRGISARVRQRLAGPMAVATGLPLALFVFAPNAYLATALLVLSGVFAVYTVEAITSFTRAVPTAARGQVVGIASSGFLVAQGMGLLLAGVAAAQLGASRTVALSGALGMLTSASVARSLAASARSQRKTALLTPDRQRGIEPDRSP
jgi:predicted MFS family arabinose efflux permease